MISFLFSFRLFCFIFFLQSTFFLFVNLFIYFATTIILQCGEKLSRVGKIITGLYLSYPGQAKFQTFPHKTRRAVYMKEKKSWPGQNGDPPCFVTLFRRWVQPPSPANFPFYKPLCSSSRVNSVKTGAILDNQSIGERCWVGQRSHLFFPKRHIIAFSSYEQSLRTFYFYKS